MAKRESFLLRIDPSLLAALRQWADDDLRSLNGQLEYLLRKSLKESGRLKHPNLAMDNSSSPDGGVESKRHSIDVERKHESES